MYHVRYRMFNDTLMNKDAPVAQMDRALPSEGRGRRFESYRVRQHHLLTNEPLYTTKLFNIPPGRE